MARGNVIQLQLEQKWHGDLILYPIPAPPPRPSTLPSVSSPGPPLTSRPFPVRFSVLVRPWLRAGSGPIGSGPAPRWVPTVSVPVGSGSPLPVSFDGVLVLVA